MSKAKEILRRCEDEAHGAINHWQEQWIIKAMKIYAKECVEKVSVKYFTVDSIELNTEEILKQIDNE